MQKANGWQKNIRKYTSPVTSELTSDMTSLGLTPCFVWHLLKSFLATKFVDILQSFSHSSLSVVILSLVSSLCKWKWVRSWFFVLFVCFSCKINTNFSNRVCSFAFTSKYIRLWLECQVWDLVFPVFPLLENLLHLKHNKPLNPSLDVWNFLCNL